MRAFLVSAYVVGLGIIFASTVYIFNLSHRQMLGLGVAAIIMLVYGVIRTWNNPNIP